MDSLRSRVVKTLEEMGPARATELVARLSPCGGALPPSSVAATLLWLVQVGRVRREGTRGRYVYMVAQAFDARAFDEVFRAWRR